MKQIVIPNDLLISVSVRFWLYLIPNIVSIACVIFVLFHLLSDRTLRQALYNHIIIVLLVIVFIYEVTSIPLMLHYYRFRDTWQIGHSFAHFWTFIDYFCYTTQLIGFAWAAIERHILVFNHQWMSTQRKRILFHYLPITLLLIYSFTYYFTLILFPFCEDFFVFSPFNGVPISCVLFDPILLTYDTIAHQALPTLLIVILSFALLIRIIIFKSHIRQTTQWRKQRKMTIQLVSISILYLLFMGPRTILQFCGFIGYLTDDIVMAYFHSGFLANYILFFLPFVCCGSMPELGKKIRNFFHCQQQAITVQIYPMIQVQTRV